jgi:hypothetical protein
MTVDTTKGRSVEMVQAELRAIETGAGSGADRALDALVAHLRREHEEARRARQREDEDDLMALPDIAVGPDVSNLDRDR